MRRVLALAVACLVVPAPGLQAGHTLSPLHTRILNAWLATKTTLRAATTRDCGCAQDVARLRKGTGEPWVPVRDYAPYLATGDFNSDGQIDFAVVVVAPARPPERSFTLLVFNGPFGRGKVPPAFIQRDLDMRGKGLFYGAPRAKPHRLVLGAFESHGAIVEPAGPSYRLDR
jgi:hypothetical protein